MFKVFDAKGIFIGFVKTPRYVKRTNSGSFTECPKKDAMGIAFKGDYYDGAGAVEVEDDIPVEDLRAIVGLDEDAMADLADMVASHEEAIAELAEMIVNNMEV